MKNFSLFKYINYYIEDQYALNVFYNILKKTFKDNQFSLANVSSITIDGRFIGETTVVSFSSKYYTPLYALTLFLSVRLVMLNPSYLELCYDEKTPFLYKQTNNFQWVEYVSIILDNYDDNDVKLLFTLLKNYYDKKGFVDDEKELFEKSIEIPEYRSEREYYAKVANKTVGVANHVIGDNAFLEDTFEDYVVTKDIYYVGNTAFAYCSNLVTIKFEDKVLFGKFPIVECNNLKQIVVPSTLADYYKKELIYYTDIITEDKSISKEADNKTIHQTSDKTTKNEESDEKEYITLKDNTLRNNNIKTPIDIKKLDLIFDNVVTSYKYFWFVSLISLAKKTDKLVISYDDIIIRMAALAWPIVFDNEIDLGKSDMLPKYLAEIKKKTKLIEQASSQVVEHHLKMHYQSKEIEKILSPLLNNVPYRFLSPWIPFTTKEEVIEKSMSTQYASLYAIHDKYIILDEDWWDYISSQYINICDFAKESFLKYAKRNNDQMSLLKFMTNGWGLV